MFAFLTIACVVFLVFNKFYVIAKKNDATNDRQSFLLFAAFMFICTVLWIAFKYAFKSTVLALVCWMLWPDIKRTYKEADTESNKGKAKVSR